MTIAQFRPESSSRGDILYSKLKPYLKDGMHILDIGCAYACLYPLINGDFSKTHYLGFDNHGGIIAELWRKHPKQVWNRIDIEDGDELRNLPLLPPSLDVAIHIGVDAESWSPIWKVHPWLIENHPPKIVLLESGRRDGYEGPMVTYKKIAMLYIDTGYKLVDFGQFDFDWGGKCLKDRHYSILTKP